MAKRLFKAMMAGMVVAVIALVLGLVVFFSIINAPTENRVGSVQGDPDWLIPVELESGKYDVWAPEGFFGDKPTVTIETEGGDQVFQSEDTGIDTNVQGYTKLGTFECDGGLYYVHSTYYGEVVFSKPTGLLCGSCITSIIIIILSGLYTFVNLIWWAKAK